MAIPVFPSLLRGIAWASSQKTEAGTIRDKMEMGQVSTRQRFSRLRRTWKVEYEYLNSTDVMAIDFFHRHTVQGGALPFFWPNLVDNAGFEYNTLGPVAGTDVSAGLLCDGWTVDSAGGCTIALGVGAGASWSGNQFVQFSAETGISVPASSTLQTSLTSNAFPVVAGLNYQYSWNVDVTVALPPAGVSVIARALLQFLNASGVVIQTAYIADQDAVTTGWLQLSSNYAAPAGAVSAQMQLLAYLVNNTTAAVTTPSTPWFEAAFDDVGVALSALTPTYGNMPSNGSIPVQVRFPKPLDFADAGWVGNEPTYRCQFELEEV